MIKLVLCMIMVIGLSSCHMHESELSQQKIFYGEPLATKNVEKEDLIPNNSFIYDPEKSDCYDCNLDELKENLGIR